MEFLRNLIRGSANSTADPAEIKRKVLRGLRDFLKRERIDEKIEAEIVGHAKSLRQKLDNKREIAVSIVKELNNAKNFISSLRREPKIVSHLAKIQSKAEKQAFFEKYALTRLDKLFFSKIESLIEEEKEEYREEKITEKLIKKDSEYVMQLISIMNDIKNTKDLESVFNSIVGKLHKRRDMVGTLFSELLEMKEIDEKLSEEVKVLRESLEEQIEQIKSWYNSVKSIYTLQIRQLFGSSRIDYGVFRRIQEQKQKMISLMDNTLSQQKNTLDRIIVREQKKANLTKSILVIADELRKEIEDALSNIQRVRLFVPEIPSKFTQDRVEEKKQFRQFAESYTSGNAREVASKIVSLLENKIRQEYGAFISRIEHVEAKNNTDIYGRKVLRGIAKKNGILTDSFNLSNNNFKNLIAYFSFLTYGNNHDHFTTAKSGVNYEFIESKYKIDYIGVMFDVVQVTGTSNYLATVLAKRIKQAA